MAPKKRAKTFLIGMRVSRALLEELDAIVDAHAVKHPASPWSRSDVLRELVMRGMAPLRARVEAMASEAP